MVSTTLRCDRPECLNKFLLIRTMNRAVHGSALDRTVYTGNVFEPQNVRIIENSDNRGSIVVNSHLFHNLPVHATTTGGSSGCWPLFSPFGCRLPCVSRR